VDLSLTWRHYGEVEGLAAANTPLPANRIDRSFSAENYFDLSGSWAITKKASLVMGVNNVLDDNPQINASVGTTGNGNTYPQTYDALGRYVFARASYKF
jgi:outer membrane receptor protein involved in Fe transport